MAVVDVRGDPPPPSGLAAAAAVLRAGGLAGVPTDTVYGLAADPFRAGATDRLFKLKGRPRSVELPVLVASVPQALELATNVPAAAARLMARYWPGALTVVLPRRPELNADLGMDDETIGLRCPAHPVPRALCADVGPLATTSANRHGSPPATTATEVIEALGSALDIVLDGGTCAGRPSTVVDCTGEEPRLLREGAVPWSEVLAVARG